MTQEKKITSPYADFGSGPFIYFDGAPAFGVLNGVVQIELAARVIKPVEGGGTTVSFLGVGHLRCSPAAAIEVRNAINQALQMLDPANLGSAPTGVTVN